MPDGIRAGGIFVLGLRAEVAVGVQGSVGIDEGLTPSTLCLANVARSKLI
jgi:hypothetical protein